MGTKTTEQAAAQLGLNQTTLITYLSRHPDLRPASRQEKAKALLWTDEEIAAVRKARAWRKSGRPKQQ